MSTIEKIKIFEENPLEYARKDIAMGLELFSKMPQIRNGKRGVDVYLPNDLPLIYVSALKNYCEFHKRLPEISCPQFAMDHLFLSKFFRYFPIKPNPSAKHTPLKYVPDNLRNLLYQPKQIVLDSPDELRRVIVKGRNPFFIKLSLGNADFIKLSPDEFNTQREAIISEMARRYSRLRYGVSWGEWVYGIGPQKIIVEQDISPIMTGIEYQFFMRAGELQLFRASSGLDTKHIRGHAFATDFFYPSGIRCPGNLRGRNDLNLDKLSGQIESMIQVCKAVAKFFDAVRVDFIETLLGPVLGELTLYTSNARDLPMSTELESAYLDSFKLEIQ